MWKSLAKKIQDRENDWNKKPVELRGFFCIQTFFKNVWLIFKLSILMMVAQQALVLVKMQIAWLETSRKNPWKHLHVCLESWYCLFLKIDKIFKKGYASAVCNRFENEMIT